MMRPLLILLLLCTSAALAQGGLPIAPVTVTIISGQQTTALRTDAAGRLFIKMDEGWKEVGSIDAAGTLSTPNASTLSLAEGGFFASDNDVTPLRLDDNATVIMNDLEVFRIQSGNLVQIEPIEQALGRNISSVRVEGPPGSDKLAAYLVAVYILMI